MEISVLAAPGNVLPGVFDGAAAIVIDALRMTSVAATAFQNGCAGLLACAQVEEARAAAAACGGLLGGERNALKIDGFDFSNSPAEYTRQRVSGRRLVMSTSNGTRAIAGCSGAKRVLLGAFLNASAVARRVAEEDRVVILCAGTLGAFTLEDALAAGAVIERLQRSHPRAVLDDMALASRRLYGQASEGGLYAYLQGTRHFSRLQSLGLEEDLHTCLSEDRLDAVGERAPDGWFYAGTQRS